MGEEKRWHEVVGSTLKRMNAIMMSIAQGVDVVIEFHMIDLAEDSATETGLFRELVE